MNKTRLNRVFAMFLSLMLLLTTVVATNIDAEAATVKPTKITLTAKSKTLYVGQKYTLKVKSVSPKKASKSVTFASSKKSVATVSSKGVITAKKKGTATITVTSKVNKKVKATCKVTVKQQVKSITVSNVKSNKATLIKGKTLTLKVKVAPSTASSKAVKYSTSNKAVATVSSKGKITAKKAGTAKITVKSADGKAKKVVTITVKNPVKVKTVKLSKKSATIYTGKTLTLKATVTPSNATNKAVTWKSSNTKVATVSSSGKITAKSAGTATITATAKDGSKKKATCKITVKKFVKATSVKLNKKSATLYTKYLNTLTLKATVAPSTASNKAVTWKSSNTKVATVSSTGKVTAKAAGTATITVTTKDGSNKKATCKVTVKKAVKLSSIKEITDKNGNVLPIRVVDGKNAYKKVLYTGNYYTVKAVASPTAPSGLKVTWKSSNPAVATVSVNGSIKAIAPGITTVTATATDAFGTKRTAKAYISVQNKEEEPVVVPVESIEVKEENIVMYGYDTVNIGAVVKPDNTTESKAVTYSSDNELVKVDAEGNVMYIGEASTKKSENAKITVTSVANASVKKEVNVTVILSSVVNKELEDSYTLTLDKDASSYMLTYKDASRVVDRMDVEADVDFFYSYKVSNETLKNQWKSATVAKLIEKSAMAAHVGVATNVEITDVTDDTMTVTVKAQGKTKTAKITRVDNYADGKFVNSSLVIESAGKTMTIAGIDVKYDENGKDYSVSAEAKFSGQTYKVAAYVSENAIAVCRVNDTTTVPVFTYENVDGDMNFALNKTYYKEFIERAELSDVLADTTVYSLYTALG